MKFGHLHLNTRDRTASENFYGRWFDMQVQRRGKLLTFLVDEYGFELALMDDTTPAAMPPWFHFGFRLNSADAVIDLNRRMMVLTESQDHMRPHEIMGHTANFLPVWVQGSSLAPNQLVKVELTHNTPSGLIGHIIH